MSRNHFNRPVQILSLLILCSNAASARTSGPLAGSAAADRSAARPRGYPVEIGDKVRLTVGGEKRVLVVEYVRPETFVALTEGGKRSVEYSFAEIDGLEREERLTPLRGALRGGGRGALAGAAIGALVGLAASAVSDCEGSLICLDPGPVPAAFFGGLAGAGAGFVVGSAVGMAFPGHCWRKVELGDRAVISMRGGSASSLALEVRF